MNHKIQGLLTFALLGAPLAALAQMETLDYTGSPFTSLSISGNLSNGLANSVLANAGDIVLSAPLGDNLSNVAVTPISWSFDSNTQLGGIYLNSNNPVAGGPGESTSFIFSTDATGMLTAWSLKVTDGILFGTNTTSFAAFTASSNAGDTFSSGFSTPACAAPPPLPNPCFNVIESGAAPGSWKATMTATPEIDPASTASGLALLLGGLVVLCGRRRLDS